MNRSAPLARRRMRRKPVCRYCGRTFAPAHPSLRYCSPDCLREADRERNSAALRCESCGTAKTSSAERNIGLDGANIHPTVKPINLMRWLVRLATPPGGLVLDPFTGSGTTGCAAVLEGFDFVGCEREAEYVAIATARIAWWASHPEGIPTAEILRHTAKRPGAEQASLALDFGDAA